VIDALRQAGDIAWGQVELFHDREYVGIGARHPASIRRFLGDRLIGRERVGRYHLLDGERDPEKVCREEGEELRAAEIDIALAGIGAQGELALNFPPADFSTERPYFVVRLDEAWRRQRVEEGGFMALGEVPDRAITISIRQLLKAMTLIACVTGPGKAEIVKRCVEGAVSPLVPASILQAHADATLYLDRHSAALLTQRQDETQPQ
jgi:glucosamine-6-phosphate deaminase